MMRTILLAVMLLALSACGPIRSASPPNAHRLLYVATPGIRDNLEYGGKGILVFDIGNAHRFVKRIPLATLDHEGKTLPVKGICANASLGLLYVSTTFSLTCLDLRSERIVWEKAYSDGCDRMSISPDGKVIYQPTYEGKYWHVLDAHTGEQVAKVVTGAGAHNTVYGRDGKFAYLAGLGSTVLAVADTATNSVARTVGPFGGNIRPFTINGDQTLCFACVNGLLGFEIGDLHSGKVLHRVEVPGVKVGPVARHGCPSHGIGLTPDEKELWVVDAFNKRVHIFDATVMPPKYAQSIQLVRDEPGWITFTRDGQFAYASTGEVIDVAAHKIVAGLVDETGRAVASEKVVEIDFGAEGPVANGDQFGIGRVVHNK